MLADMEAGIGTLTRLGESGVDAVLIVVEPTPKSIEVASRAMALVEEKGFSRVIVVANRVRDEDDLEQIRKAFPSVDVVAVPDDPAIVEADRQGVAPLDLDPEAPAVLALVELAEKSLLPLAS